MTSPQLAVRPSPLPVLAALVWRQVRVGAGVVAAVCAGMSALVVSMYRVQELDPASMAALAANPAIRTLFGEPVALEQAGGFTVWRTGTVLAVLIAVWSFMTAVRITRGDEEAGRWSLLLSGRVTLPEAGRAQLGVLALAPVVTGTGTAAAMVLAGAEPGGSLLHGAGLAGVGLCFVAVGGLAAQLLPTRAGANGAAAAVLLVALLARMVGDGVTALAGLRWFSPLGLLALTRPFGTERWLPVAVQLVAAAAVLALTGRLAGRRDLGAAVLAGRGGRRARTTWLGSVPAFAARRTLRPLAGWATGIATYFLLVGLTARSVSDFLADNPRFADLAAEAGFALGTVQGYAATLFALLAVPVGVFPAARIAALAAEEDARRLALVLAAPVTRARLLAGEVVVAGTAALLLLVVAATAFWAGARTVDAGLSFGESLSGTLNVVPLVLLCLGAATVALGWAPRAVTALGGLPVTAGFLWLVLADSVDAPGWVGRLSPFAHLAPVPLATPGWSAAGVMVAVAALAHAGGSAGYLRRDLRA